ncbi:hypothetical protein BN863_15170 [Formosa agariphila KMM 3901]|uniref:Uncharacterized protein n=1 Tax=Formosa agariphila (strain DSM 15362 / KCTC 12365 / LMG 23005 / KMM 3901 / M-2Alg 35-1) TaxID=1347342 RepID=T2KMM6_FORAG|nr:hypothetical protein [Formosa agariphila]CDF79229.1 hypothetical protein BN863_15170 [Formosa agariphila KMM 3901]
MHLYKLDIDLDYTHQDSTGELESWIHHLEGIKKELKTFCTKKKYSKHALIKKAVLLKASTNNSILKTLRNYKEFREFWNTCDAAQSGMAFIREHNKHKSDYLKHINEYKSFKSKLTV